MKTTIKKVSVLFIVMLVSCGYFTTTPIGKILSNPRDYNDQHVTIKGQVTEVMSFFVIKYFKVKDKTGEIAVVTEKILPAKGSTIQVKGRVQEAFSLGDQSLIVIVED